MVKKFFLIYLLLFYFNAYGLSFEKTNINWAELKKNNYQNQHKIQFLEEAELLYNKLKSKKISYVNKREKWIDRFNLSRDKLKYLEENGIDCSHFLWFFFSFTLKFPYNYDHPNEIITTDNFNNLNKIENFSRLDISSHKIHTGDILVTEKLKHQDYAHALIVIDANKCVALHSVMNTYLENNQKYSGVLFQNLFKYDCDNGNWKSLDLKHKFKTIWRHHYFL